MTTLTHPFAQFTHANQIPDDFLLISSDDSGEQESFEDIFGADFEFVKADYPTFFVFQTEDMTVIYGSTRVAVPVDGRVVLLYFWSMENIKEGAYSPYAGSSLESLQVWGHETFTPYEKHIEYSGLMPLLERPYAHEKYFVGKTHEQNPRLVLIYNRRKETTAFLLTRLDALRLHTSLPNEILYEKVLRIIDKWGVK